jgi:hypothetical protein
MQKNDSWIESLRFATPFPIHLSSNLNSNTVFVYWSQLPNPFIAIAWYTHNPMLCHGGRTWLVYYGCFWSQHVHTVHVFLIDIPVIPHWFNHKQSIDCSLPLSLLNKIHWCSQNSPWSVYKSVIMSPLSIVISSQKSEHSIFMNIAKVLNGKLFQSFHNVKGERILSCDVLMHLNVLNNVGWIYQWNLKCTLALVFGTKKWTRLAEP